MGRQQHGWTTAWVDNSITRKKNLHLSASIYQEAKCYTGLPRYSMAITSMHEMWFWCDIYMTLQQSELQAGLFSGTMQQKYTWVLQTARLLATQEASLC